MGNPTRTDFNTRVVLVAETDAQIRDNALEALRMAVNKRLEKRLGVENYLFRVKVLPHVVLRENKMLATAGADRLQEGMRRAFGKPIGRAARVKKGTEIAEVRVMREHEEVAKDALRTGSYKLPIKTHLITQYISS